VEREQRTASAERTRWVGRLAEKKSGRYSHMAARMGTKYMRISIQVATVEGRQTIERIDALGLLIENALRLHNPFCYVQT
jgi:hypothetical protein